MSPVARAESGGAELLEAISGDWHRLANQGQACEPFALPEWGEAYLRAFAPYARLFLLTAWNGPSLSGALPLLSTREFMSGFPVAKLKSCGNVHSCRCDMVCADGDEGEQAAHALWTELSRLPGWDMLEFSSVPEGAALDRLLRAASTHGCQVARKPLQSSLHVTIAQSCADPEPWLAGTSRKFRANLRRSRHQVEEQGELTLRRFTGADPEVLERFFALEASGWKGSAGTAIACQPETRLFYELIAKAAARDGYLALDFLYLNDRPIAAHFALYRNHRYFVLKAAYDESFSRFGPGHLIVEDVLRAACPAGLRQLDFVGPATWDETRWAAETRQHYQIFVFRNNWYGAWLHFLRISGRAALKSVLGIHNQPQDAPPRPVLACDGNGKLDLSGVGRNGREDQP